MVRRSGDNDYGSDRTTKDIDIIADKLLPLENAGLLHQGGERYIIKTNKKAVAVGWIICRDEFGQLFHEAFTEAVDFDGVPIPSTERLVILKFIAGRFKDREDEIFLLSQKNLVIARASKTKSSNASDSSPGAWQNTAVDGSTI